MGFQDCSPELTCITIAFPYSFARDCDGFLSVSSQVFESDSLDALRTWLAETNRPLYTIGPLVPPGFGDAAGLSTIAKQKEIDSLKNGSDFQTFLDAILKSHGEHSLIYVRLTPKNKHILRMKRSGVLTRPLIYLFLSKVSFGSFLWPSRSEHVWVMIDMLLQLKFPFVRTSLFYIMLLRCLGMSLTGFAISDIFLCLS